MKAREDEGTVHNEYPPFSAFHLYLWCTCCWKGPIMPPLKRWRSLRRPQTSEEWHTRGCEVKCVNHFTTILTSFYQVTWVVSHPNQLDRQSHWWASVSHSSNVPRRGASGFTCFLYWRLVFHFRQLHHAVWRKDVEETSKSCKTLDKGYIQKESVINWFTKSLQP